MSIIDDLCNDKKWDEFLSKRKSGKNPTTLSEFIENREYRSIVEAIRDGTYVFGNAKKIEIPKPSSDKKRIIYTFKRKDDQAEHMVIRMFSYLLSNEYDSLLSDNLYSFRLKGGVQKAIARMRSLGNIGTKYCYKVDITEYFNSIPADKMNRTLEKSRIAKDARSVIKGILSNPMVSYMGEDVEDTSKGIMPGLPFATFLSNLYLNGMDQYFHEKKVQYYRFADDILVMADSQKELNRHVGYIRTYIKKRGLSINPDKEMFYEPGKRIEFLGLYIENDIFDLNKKALDRALRSVKVFGRHYRKKVELKEKTVDDAIHCFLVKMDHKFFGWEKNSKSCWWHWYGPLLNTDRSMKIIDRSIQDWMRYIITGKHTKGNLYRIPYKKLKDMGYWTLVNRKYKSNPDNRQSQG